MTIQTATTGNLASAQKIIIAAVRFYGEQNAPCANLIEKFSLGQGAKQITVPKVGQNEASDLTDGVDIVNTEEIGMTTVDLAPLEVGLKVIVTDKLVRQEQPSVFAMVGRQMGNAMARKRDKDVIALFTALNSTTVLGADGKYLNIKNASACTGYASGNYGGEPLPQPISCVHHPNAIAHLARSASSIASVYYTGIMGSFSESLLRNFWKLNINNVNFYSDGNIVKESTVDSGKGAIFSKSAMAIVESQAPRVERERDASLRATEIVIVSDYGCFELEDEFGFPMQYEIGNLTTSDTEGEA